ncbi:hypothetical protein [Caballeronia sp. Lep1P3]|uniref:hypothetical protein n=1 Tax=Caballeronia sp. Lep1P3 TaxID=2878150 RepID=UPI001FD60254|nr:hypothetical protein [Caballeronia sp. Lep1P3]
MKRIALSCAAGAFALVCASAFAQDNPPSSATGLQAGDNAQTTTQGAGSSGSSHKSHAKRSHHSHSSTNSSGSSTTPGGTATPGGPGAPVSASGSGQ